MNAIDLQKAIREIIRDLGYKMNRRWVIETKHHRLDNMKLGGWDGPQVWLDGHQLTKTTNLEVLEDARKELLELVAQKEI